MTTHASSRPEPIETVADPPLAIVDRRSDPLAANPTLFLQSLFGRSADGVLATDAQGYRIYSNPALDSMLGTDGRLPLRSSAPPPYVPLDQHQEYWCILQAVTRVLRDNGSVAASLVVVNRHRERIRTDLAVGAFAPAGGSTVAIWLVQDRRQSRATGVGSGSRVEEPTPWSHPTQSGGGREAAGVQESRSPELRTLTTREGEVLRMLLEGWRVSSIARALFVSEHTVRNHLKAIFRKLGAHSQLELIERLKERGTVS